MFYESPTQLGDTGVFGQNPAKSFAEILGNQELPLSDLPCFKRHHKSAILLG